MAAKWIGYANEGLGIINLSDLLQFRSVKIIIPVSFPLQPYGCCSSGDEIGMIEVVTKSNTTANIQQVKFARFRFSNLFFLPCPTSEMLLD